MLRSDLAFDRPARLQAVAPPEAAGRARDDVRLLVTDWRGVHHHVRFADLPEWLDAGDLLVVNNSATLAASLPARSGMGLLRINLCTEYGKGLWLVEPRYDHANPGPVSLRAGETLAVGDARVRLIAPLAQQPRLWFAHFAQDAHQLAAHYGEPIRYAYVEKAWPLADYQTLFARLPGSAEMASAGRPFTQRTLARLRLRGIDVAEITLHTGVSSLEVESEKVEEHTLYPEPFVVSQATADCVNATRAAGRHVIAVGTTVVKALESAWDGEKVRPARGFSHLLIHPGHDVRAVDGLVTGFHDPYASHLALLYALTPAAVIRSAYAEATARGYLWHEFGDSHLILRGPASGELGLANGNQGHERPGRPMARAGPN